MNDRSTNKRDETIYIGVMWRKKNRLDHSFIVDNEWENPLEKNRCHKCAIEIMGKFLG